MNTLGAAKNHIIFWNGYNVRSMESLCLGCDHVVKKENIGGPPIGL